MNGRDDRDDEWLMDRVARGERDCLEVLVRRHADQGADDREVRGAGRVTRLVMTRLADQMSCPPALAELAAEAGMSRYQLVRSFRAEAGMPPYAWLAQHRVTRARRLLDRIEPRFSPTTWQAFQRVMGGEKPAAVAANLKISLNAVYHAKSAVLMTLRQEMEERPL